MSVYRECLAYIISILCLITAIERVLETELAHKRIKELEAADKTYIANGCLKNDQTGLNFCCPGWEFKEGSN